MDWELKTSAWDFTDLGTDDSLVGSSGLSPNINGRDFSVDLKLGGLGDMCEDKGKLPKDPFNNSSPSGSSKKARAISGTQNVTCLVDGCIADLSGCREYHRRHRVCERHSKTPVVSIRGKEQRFCQQCSRFQSLNEFDEEKRSCRKRLDGHNRRRRKPQPEALYMNHGSFVPHHQGARLLKFSGPEAYTTSAVPTWPSVPRHPVPLLSSTFPNLPATIHNGVEKRFPFLLGNDPERSNVLEVNTHSCLAQNSAPANVNPHRAHSLLSSPCLYQNPPFSLSTHQQISSASLQFEFPTHQYSRSIPALVPQASNYENNYNGHEIKMASLSPDDLLEKGSSQVFPFAWKQ